jgi:hypothetical protein
LFAAGQVRRRDVDRRSLRSHLSRTRA